MSTTTVGCPPLIAPRRTARSWSAVAMPISASAATTGTPLTLVRRYLMLGTCAHLPRRHKSCPGDPGGSAQDDGRGRQQPGTPDRLAVNRDAILLLVAAAVEPVSMRWRGMVNRSKRKQRAAF